MIRLALIGASGRLGSAIEKLARASEDLAIVARPRRGEEIPDVIQDCDVVIDVSQPEAIAEICRACVRARKPLVIGTTGHSREQNAVIADAAKAIGILQTANFSRGVNVLFALTRRAAQLLGSDFDLEISETHHEKKKDAPSGTAKRLVKILSDSRGIEPEKIITHSLRLGDVVGNHTIVFSGPGEQLELTHRAESRETFASGALVAARWIVQQSAGLYSMEDALGLSA